MEVLRVFCKTCGHRWEVYNTNQATKEARMCPFCQSEIDKQIWDKFIRPAYGMLADANRELKKHHLGYDAPLFGVDAVIKRPSTEVK